LEDQEVEQQILIRPALGPLDKVTPAVAILGVLVAVAVVAAVLG
jgi:hypothetical protein